MFTGIVSDMGRVVAAPAGGFRIACRYGADSLAIGGSVACDGCCLTVTAVEGIEGGGAVFTVDASNETRTHTTLGEWRVGRAVNLERPLRLQDEIGGHLLTGHVDGVATILERRQDGESVRFHIEAPAGLARFVAPKGSVALDGVSLTVNEVEGATFGVNIIPHTLRATTWCDKGPGDRVNLEVDLLARYVARIAETMAGERAP